MLTDCRSEETESGDGLSVISSTGKMENIDWRSFKDQDDYDTFSVFVCFYLHLHLVILADEMFLYFLYPLKIQLSALMAREHSLRF